MLILTPNQRLARALRRDYDNQKGLENSSIWPSAEIYPLLTWLPLIWEKFVQFGLFEPHYLLNEIQKAILWKNIIQKQDYSLNHLSSLAVKAWSLVHEWEYDVHDSKFLLKEETAQFQQWALSYQKLLYSNAYLDIDTLFFNLIRFFKTSSRETKQVIRQILPSDIILWGFTEFSAREKTLWRLLSEHGITISEKQYPSKQPQIAKIEYADEYTEIEAAAKWAKLQCDQNKHVACIFPELNTYKNKILATFERYFENPALINISLGKSLTNYELIQSALLGLSLCLEKIETKLITPFLLSPYFTFKLEFQKLSSRALLDKKLQATSGLIVDTNDILKLINIESFHISESVLNTPKQWAKLFQDKLHQLGFLRDKKLDTEEFQLLNHWQILIENFSQLNILLNKINIHTALYYLNHLAQNTLFQPKQSPDIQIEILGILEAAGLSFDAIWIAGLHDNAWPPAMVPNPFLPFSLTTINKRFYEKITQQFFSSSKEIILSASQTVDNISTFPSNFLSTFKSIQNDFIISSQKKIIEKKYDLTYHNGILEYYDDHQAPALNLTQIKHHGSDIIKDQAACPFRAFAKHRLGAKKMDTPELGINALIKGNYIHLILEKFFEKYDQHFKLTQTTEKELSLLLSEIIDNVLIEKLNSRKNSLFSKTEKYRLHKLLLEWLLHYEINRSSFIVAAREEKIEMKLGSLPLKLRIDRIDKISDNHYIIIDYKTGKTLIKIDPLDEPQLPLYCIAKNDLPIKEVAIAQIRPNDMRFKPILAEKKQWETILLQTANAYTSGIANIQPRHGEETCRYCDLSLLCRIKEKMMRDTP